MKKKKISMLLLAFGFIGLASQAQPTKPGYKLIFSEDFNDPTWSSYSSKWWRENYYGLDHSIPPIAVMVGDGHPITTGSQVYNLSVPGYLQLTALDQTAPADMCSTGNPDPAHQATSCFHDIDVDGNPDCVEDYDYITGAFDSYDEYSYGYFEIRCRIPKENTFWQSFWLYGQNGDGEPGPDWYNEIDIFEQVDIKDVEEHWPLPDVISWHQTLQGNVHYNSCVNAACTQKDIVARGIPGLPFDLFPANAIPAYDLAYHTYAVEWDPSYMIWYVDGNPVRIIPCNPYTPKHLMRLIVSFGMRNNVTRDAYGNITGLADPRPDPSSFPAAFVIDYIRVWKKQQITNFGSGPTAGGWNSALHKRMIADVNGDGKDDIVGFGQSQVIIATANQAPLISGLPSGIPVPNKYFFNSPSAWITGFGPTQGWDMNNHPRFVEDVTGDGKADIVGFADAGVLLAISTGSSFGSPTQVVNSFGAGPTAGGWDYSKHRRMVKDINNDGYADIVGIGASNVFVSLGTTTGFTSPVVWLANDFTYSQGWRVEKNPIELADVNGDNYQDIVGFFNDGVWVSYGIPSGGFQAKSKKLSVFGYNISAGSWRIEDHLRLMADMDGDNKDDIVAFGENNVMVARATSTGFLTPVVWTEDFGRLDGWTVGTHTRMLRDMNGEGFPDIVGFGDDGVYVSLTDAAGLASKPTFLLSNYYGNNASAGAFSTANEPRTMGDFSGDGQADLITFSPTGVMAQVTSECFGATNVLELEPYLPKSMEIQPQDPSIEMDGITIYPNPSNGIFNVNVSHYVEGSNCTYQVNDLGGKMIVNGTINANLTQIDLNDLTGGLYIITIKSGTETSRFKVIKNAK